MKIKKEAAVNEGASGQFSTDEETLTLDITGDKAVPIWEPRAPKETFDLRED